MNVGRVLAVAHKEAREILRDRIYGLLAFLLPVMLMLVLGYGMTHDVENVPFAILDYDRTDASREYAQHFIGSRYFAYQGAVRDLRQADQALMDSKLRVVLVIPEKFQEDLARGRTAEVQMLLDGTFTTAARTVQGYVEAISADASSQVTLSALVRRRGLVPERARALAEPARLEIRYLYNQEARSIWSVAPLLVMFILTWITPLLLGLNVVREKETGSIYNIYASTVTRAEFMAGKLLPNVVICCLNAAVLWAMAVFYFGAPFKGSLPAFALGTLLFVTASSGLGLLISLAVRTQQAALMLSIIVGMLIAGQYSGMQTPVADLPPVNSAIAHALPAMYYTALVEGCFLKGSGLPELWGNLAALAVIAAGMLTLGHALFRKRVRG